MQKRTHRTQWLAGLTAAATTIVVAIVGCTGDGDTINNYQEWLGSDSGIDVQVFQSLGCSAGKKECVSDNVARICPSDGSAWVAVSCRVGEKCGGGDCKPVAGGPTAACIPSDGACLPGNKALRCKADGTGYEQIDCPASTTCQDRGVCKGVYAVGESSCTGDRKAVTTSADGFHQTTTDCASGEYCVTVATVPIATAACKPATCKPNIGNSVPCGERSVCGDPSNPANDQTKYVATCRETPEGWKWVGTACTAGQTCNPNATTCSAGNSFDAACSGGCTPNAVRCAPNGQGVQTCQGDGTWGAATQCNVAQGERCINLFSNASKAVCGDPICGQSATNGVPGVCDENSGGFRACDATTGKLTAAQQCAHGRCQKLSSTGFPPPQDYVARCLAECVNGAEDCFGNGSYRTCTNGRFSAPIGCDSADGAFAICLLTTDNATQLSKHSCVVGYECSPGTRRCVSSDAGAVTDQIQLCGLSGKWEAAQTCAVGTCTSAYSGGAQCVADCVPGAAICDPAGSGKYYACPANGKFLASPTYSQVCSGTASCKRAGSRSLGCVECVGPNLTDPNGIVYYAESRCLLEDGGVGGSSMLQSCKADNTWGTPMTCAGGTPRCASSFNASPFTDPGGVRYGYCY